MNPLRFLLLLFVLVPLVEIAILIQAGGVIGVGWTVFCVVLTAAVGALLVRAQGLSTLLRANRSMRSGVVPAVEMLEGACLLVAGALLLTPGFVTDAAGFLLLTPALRRRAIRRFIARGIPGAPPPHSTRPPLEGDFRRVDDD